MEHIVRLIQQGNVDELQAAIDAELTQRAVAAIDDLRPDIMADFLTPDAE